MQQLELSLLTHRNKHALYAVNILFLLQGLAKDSGYCFVSAAVAACLVYVLSAAPVSWQQVAKAAVSNGGKPPGTTAITRQQPANWGRRKMVEGGRGGGGGGGGLGVVGGGWGWLGASRGVHNSRQQPAVYKGQGPLKWWKRALRWCAGFVKLLVKGSGSSSRLCLEVAMHM